MEGYSERVDTAVELDLRALDAKLKTILPEEYRERYEDVQPVSMGSAGLKFDGEGRVAWDEIWGSFCDLALAGGPPHKGSLLEPATQAEIGAQPERYREVVEEICRGIRMVTDLPVEPSVPGWVRVECDLNGMAGWLVRAIAMENVSVHAEPHAIHLPAGPHYRLEKEIKNVITVIAKTCHYFLDHMWAGQQRDIAELFAKTEAEAPLIQPTVPGFGFDAEAHRRVSAAIVQSVELPRAGTERPGWVGVECSGVRAAIWRMRALAVFNVISRREETVLFLPVNPLSDPTGERVVQAFTKVHELAIHQQRATSA